MGIYRRSWRRRDGKVIISKPYWMSAMVDGRQVCRSTGTANKRLAQRMCDAWRAEIAQGRFDLLKKAPKLKEWAENYLKSIDHPNTRRRYASSKQNLVGFFGENAGLDHISVVRIEQFKQQRRTEEVKGSTINRDLRFLAQILKQAERERYLARSPFDRARFFLNESRERRKPYVLSSKDEQQILATARPRIRLLVALGVDTGMRTGEMLGLRWKDIDFLNHIISVERSKTASGIRIVPMSKQCKIELVRWRNLLGPDFSEWVFPNFENRRHKLQGGRKAWASTLEKAGLPFFPIYYLRHTFASRLTAAGVSPLVIAQLLGHSSTQIVPRYAQVIDENRLDAIRKLEALRQASNDAHDETQTKEIHPPGDDARIHR
jgi:integrase